jgi:hypothetical protein
MYITNHHLSSRPKNRISPINLLLYTWIWLFIHNRVTIIYHSSRSRKYPAVAQPGRAFGCRSWLMIRYQADRVNSLSGIHCAVTEESQAQTRLAKSCFGANPARGIYSCYYILYCKTNHDYISFDAPRIIAFLPSMKSF